MNQALSDGTRDRLASEFDVLATLMHARARARENADLRVRGQQLRGFAGQSNATAGFSRQLTTLCGGVRQAFGNPVY